MAQGGINLPGKGSFGNISMFTRKDGKVVFRSKGGASADKINNDPEFAAQRKQMSRFGGCSTAAKMIRNAMPNIGHLAYSAFHGDLVNIASSLMALDASNPMDGKKSIIFSNGLALLQGFQMNKENNFDSVITTPIGCVIKREDSSATLQLPPLLPGKNFRPPWGYPYYRLRVNLGIIRDMFFDGVAYSPITPHLQEHSEKLDLPWTSVKDIFPTTEIRLKFDDPVFDQHCHLMVAIGVEFGVHVAGEITHVKHAGCGKILAVG